MADTLTKEKLLDQAALHHLRQQAFTWYDPDVVNAFMKFLKTVGIRQKGEQKVSINQLKQGMVLSRGLFTDSRNRFLLSFETMLTREHIKKLKQIDKTNPVTQIYCKKHIN